MYFWGKLNWLPNKTCLLNHDLVRPPKVSETITTMHSRTMVVYRHMVIGRKRIISWSCTIWLFLMNYHACLEIGPLCWPSIQCMSIERRAMNCLVVQSTLSKGRFTLWTMKSDHGRWPFSMVRVHGPTSKVRLLKKNSFESLGPLTKVGVP